MSEFWYICTREGAEIPSTAIGYASPVGCAVDNRRGRQCVVVAVKADVGPRLADVEHTDTADAAKHVLSEISFQHVMEKEDLAVRLEESFRTVFYQELLLNGVIKEIIAACGLSNLPATVEKSIHGFKALYMNMHPGWGPKDFFYEIGRQYRMDGLVAPCNRGYHFCKELADVFNFYETDARVFEVEASGRVVKAGTKSVASRIRLIREIDRDELIERLKKSEGLFWRNIIDDTCCSVDCRTQTTRRT